MVKRVFINVLLGMDYDIYHTYKQKPIQTSHSKDTYLLYHK